ncbi:unnamed protein product [Heterosigma akashiwo]
MMRMPLTPYRSFPQSQVQDGARKVKGIEDVLADVASLQVMLDNLGKNTEKWKQVTKSPNTPRVEMKYKINQKELLVQGDMIMANWNMQTSNAMARGALAELKLYGEFNI